MQQLILFMSAFVMTGLIYGAEPVLKYKGKSLSFEDLETKTQLQLYEADLEAFQAKKRILEDYLFQLYLRDYAKAKGLQLEDAQRQLLAGKAVTEAELKAFYEKNRDKIPYPFEQVRDELDRFVRSQQEQDQKNQLLEKLLSEKSTAILLSRPQAPQVSIKTDEFYRKGKSGAPIVIAEFADYKCPHCRHAYLVLEELFKAEPDRVQIVFIDFAFLSALSKRLAVAAYCAHQQNAYWKYHQLIFDNQVELTERSVTEFAETLKLKMDVFKKCLVSDAAEDMVEKGKSEGERLGVTGTPTLFINGSRYTGPIELDSLQSYIKNL